MPVDQVAKIITNWRTAALDDQEKAMLAFTEKFTLTPSKLSDEDLEKLRRAGFGESEILAIVLELVIETGSTGLLIFLVSRRKNLIFPKRS